MKDKDKGVLYAHMFVGTLGLMIVGLSLLHQFFETRSLGSILALIGFPLVMIYLNYIESKSGVPKKIIIIRSIIATLLIIIYYLAMIY
ncbi:hypothetical protein QT711_18280 [Sporosarcina saromensis]|uniref:Uncharacterized protein n=1 Tax=Sporosarcina saromensis TaxID=359365 RepID=A0ABU4GFI5_9BACL|nr:hypothetical protein [Sporosarcina saromensis]MDW0115112.1 hypothetical protein [Sporosarcina saromensis]